MNATKERIKLCLGKDIIQEKAVSKKNITNNVVDTVSKLKPNKNVKMITSLNDLKVNKTVALISNDLYSVPINKLQKTKKVDNESVRKIECLKLNHLIHHDENRKGNLFGQNNYTNDNKYAASKILCLKKDIDKLETAIEQFNHLLQLQRHEIAKIKKWLTSTLDFGSKLRLFPKEKQGAINFFKQVRII